jgi:hypothetical protein
LERKLAFLLAPVLFGLGAAISLSAGAEAGHSWGCYKWSTPNLRYRNIAQSPYNTYYEQETRTDTDSWHNYTVINWSSGSGVDMESGQYGNTGWLGIATISIRNGCTIVSGRTRLNRTYLDNGQYSTDAKKRVACHEVGHTTGLNHNPLSSSCLKTGGSAVSRPNSHDRDVLAAKYR